MASVAPNQSVIPVSVAVAEKYRGLLADGRVRERCEAYLRELLESLRLPARAQLAVTAGGELADHDDVRVTFHETPVGARRALELDADGLTELITSTLCRCRVLLLDDALIDALWSTYFAGAGPVWSRPPPDGFANLCRELVRRGIGPARARGHRESISRAAVNGDDMARVVEEVMARPERAAIRLLASDETYRQCYDENGKAVALPGEEQDFEGMWRLMVDGLFWEHGIVYRVAGMQRDTTLAAPWFRIAWNDIVTPPARGLATGEFLVNDTVERLSLLGDDGVEQRAVDFNPANGNECTRVRGNEAARKACDDIGLTTWGPQGCLVLAVTAEIRANAGAFVTSHLTAFFEAQLERAFPDLVREARARFSREHLTQVLRRLSDEGISVRDLRAILEALLSVIGVTTADVGRDIVFTGRTGLIFPVPEGQSLADLQPADHADAVRMALKRYLSHKYSRGSGTLVVYLLDPGWEAKLSGKEPLAPAGRQQLLEAIAEELGALARRAPAAVILTTHYARRRLREIVQYDFPGVAVLSYQELAPDINIQPIARISPPATPAVREAKKG